MDWLERMKNALAYMEEHLEEDFSVDDVARIALSSSFHFQKMFFMLTGFTIAEYIRKRRLTLAAQELASTNIRVLDAALKYGYDTPEAFCKAFRKFHEITPSAAREPGVKLKSFAPLSFHIQIKGGQDMNYHIVNKEAFKVIGKGIRVSTQNGENFRRIPEFWRECSQDGTCEKLCTLDISNRILGICADFDHQKEELTYLIAIEKPAGEVGDDFIEKEIPASTWAVFESVGPIPTAIQKVTERIYSEWFPATGYEHANTPDIENYLHGNLQDPEYRCEVWIPIIKK